MITSSGPSVETFLIPEFLPDTVQHVMSTWAPEVEFKLDAGNLPPEVLVALIEEDSVTTKQAERAIMFDVVQAVERNYRDLPVGMLFERDSIGFTFQIWDYNQTAMEYTPRPAFATDSAVSSVLDLLRNVGYLPGERLRQPAGRTSEPGLIVSADDALLAIEQVPDEQQRQLAIRTVLLGSFDFDRSGSIDRPREIDAISCGAWASLDIAFPGFLRRFGFTTTDTPYLGSLLFSISEAVRLPAGRRAEACFDDRTPPTTVAADTLRSRQGPLPATVAGFVPMDAAAAIVQRAGAKEPGSVEWIAEVRSVLLARFDADSSGQLDGSREIESIPCVVWQAVTATHDAAMSDFGFDESRAYEGELLGVPAGRRAQVLARVESCLAEVEETVTVRVGPPPTDQPQPGTTRPAMVEAAASSLTSVAQIADPSVRERTARTVLVTYFDSDRSGYIDTAAEANAMTCEVWQALEAVFPGFTQTYGFVPSPGGAAHRYRGGVFFHISVRLKDPVARRITTCRNGQAPAPILPQEVSAVRDVIQLPSAVQEFLDVAKAAEFARTVFPLEPGSAEWSAALGDLLLEGYDFDRSGMVDSALELGAVPCVLWQTAHATYTDMLEVLSSQQTGRFLASRLHLAEDLRLQAAARISGCRN